MKENKKLKVEAWNIAFERFINKYRAPTLGQIFGGCPNCGHACSWDDEEYKCYRCGWDWKKEVKE